MPPPITLALPLPAADLLFESMTVTFVDCREPATRR
jgi:hypothetical protein